MVVALLVVGGVVLVPSFRAYRTRRASMRLVQAVCAIGLLAVGGVGALILGWWPGLLLAAQDLIVAPGSSNPPTILTLAVIALGLGVPIASLPALGLADQRVDRQALGRTRRDGRDRARLRRPDRMVRVRLRRPSGASRGGRRWPAPSRSSSRPSRSSSTCSCPRSRSGPPLARPPPGPESRRRSGSQQARDPACSMEIREGLRPRWVS